MVSCDAAVAVDGDDVNSHLSQNASVDGSHHSQADDGDAPPGT
jgi:hypothetical protein